MINDSVYKLDHKRRFHRFKKFHSNKIEREQLETHLCLFVDSI